ncbi:MAG: hypothetical protein DWQ08_15790 [Proteobacteria bacterium]|nr:MAG: hypothetical protein DWQ08_15790 [Pseudomonadota bacterium]
MLLAVTAFSLSLLGTFLVRSGVLTSVHAFASDPTRGTYILVSLCIVVGGSLALYAWRAPTLRGTGQFDTVSRESGILINNILLLIAAVCILLGTLFPLFMDALGLGKYSVGPPYFNKIFVPLMAPLGALVGIGALIRWKRDRIQRLGRPLLAVLTFSVVAGFLYPLSEFGDYSLGAAFGMTLGFWVISSNLLSLVQRMGYRWRPALLRSAPIGFYGMIVAHIGIGLFVIGVTMVSAYEFEKDLSMSPGDRFEVGENTFIFQDVRGYTGPNYVAQRGSVEVELEGGGILILHPEKRSYGAGAQTMTEAAIDAGLTRDLYVSLGEPLGGNAWAVRIYYKPYIRFIWLGFVFMALGGMMGAADKRYRTERLKVAERERTAGAH